MRENSPVGTTVCLRGEDCSVSSENGKVRAVDPEGDSFKFSIDVDSIEPEFPFKISEDGLLTVFRNIDREQKKVSKIFKIKVINQEST